MPTSLVTGGAGFIGSHVVDHLLKLGHRVVILDDLSGGSRDNLPDPRGYDNGRQWDLYNYSILDDKVIEEIFYREAKYYEPISYVFHLAAYAAESLSHHIRHYNYEVNVLGSVNLINAAVNYGVKRFVFTSSAAVYGDTWPGVEQAEWFDLRPVDPYGVAKAAVENDLRLAQKTFGLSYTIFRMHNVYGPRQNLNDPYRNVIGIFMRQTLRGEPMTIYGDGQQTRQFTCINDVAPHIARCVEMPETTNSTYNIGSAELHTINDVAWSVSRHLGCPNNKVYLPSRHEVAHIYLSHHLFNAAFGMGRHISFDEGIAVMASWAKTQKLKEPEPFANIEIEKNLPEHWRKLNGKTT